MATLVSFNVLTMAELFVERKSCLDVLNYKLKTTVVALNTTKDVNNQKNNSSKMINKD